MAAKAAALSYVFKDVCRSAWGRAWPSMQTKRQRKRGWAVCGAEARGGHGGGPAAMAGPFAEDSRTA
eukprot:6630844-Lingulodinium_polyedra.AAC.1